jgi:hypothetical protein
MSLAMNIQHRKPLDEKHSAKPAGAEFWHIWTVRFPHRSIAGGLAWGRRDGHRWVYAPIDTPKAKLFP